MDNNGPYLFKISMPDKSSTEDCILLIENEHLDTVELYKKQADSLVLLAVKGNSFSHDDSRSGFPEFRLSGNLKEYYIKTTFKKDVSFTVQINTLAAVDKMIIKVFFLLGLYYGISLMFFFLNLCLFIYLRDKSFIYYCAFQLFIVLSIAYADGLLTFITPGPWMLNHADIPLHLGMAISGSLFAHTFLTTTYLHKKIWIVAGILTLILISFTLSIIFNNYFLFLTGELVTFIVLCFYWVAGLLQFKVNIYSRFFVIGYGAFLIFAIDYFILRKFGIFYLDVYSGQIKTGSIIEMLVLTIAIIFRIKTLREENLHYRLEIDQYMRRVFQLQTEATETINDLFRKVQLKYKLSDREIEVLHGITDGLTNNQIADKIFLSTSTIKFHTRNIFEKMEITNRTQALGRLHEH
ncbi:7TM diverse intracellular signaling domain-containing protein [Pedobacter metabolipauper]|nr:7TM diverse intracellular signaling domain-containing protein [Pedobacter metabolipauper]